MPTPVHSMTILNEMLGVMAYKFQHVEHQQNIEIYCKTFAKKFDISDETVDIRNKTIKYVNIKNDSEVLVP